MGSKRKRGAQAGKQARGARGWLWRWSVALVGVVALLYGFCAATLAALRVVRPPTTAVQIERRVEAWWAGAPYRKQMTYVPLKSISPHLRHAVIAAEDARFYQHSGIDWVELNKAVEEHLEEGKALRGASTITQQLVKNLFLTTSRTGVRKALEFSLVPLAELLLSKDRILELYLNVVEWGPGVYGAEAAARYHYQTAARNLSREQAARLAACLPAPRARKPQRMNRRAAQIMERMEEMGW